MIPKSFIPVFTVSLLISLTATPHVSADVSPGDVIDKSNWQKVEGLLPEEVLNWVKKGDFILEIGKLEGDTGDFYPEAAKQAFQANVGKYDLDEAGGVVEIASGKLARPIGLPFPQIDLKDPKSAEKIMQNQHYQSVICGNLDLPSQLIWLSRSGFEREVGFTWLNHPMVGWPGALELSNPQGIEKYAILRVNEPFDLAGTAILLWRYLAPDKQDSTYGYLPAIRRVRRMSPANRSDAFVGSDCCVDDANGYDGKISDFKWKLVKKQEGLVPWLDSRPIRVTKNRKEEWETTKDVKPLIYGYEKEGWQGAPWAPTNLVWVKRPVYVLQMTPKDPYYNYGTHYMWVDAPTYGCFFKVIHDRAGVFWKVFMKADALCESDDKSMRYIALTHQLIIDEKRDHATKIGGVSPTNIWTSFAKMDENDFSLAGFQKFCK